MQRPALPLEHARLEAMHRRTVLALLSMGLWPSLALARNDVYARRVLVTHDGKQTSLAVQANGWHLVVVVMKGHWCRVCVAQLERLAELSATLKSLTARVVGLNADAPESNRKLVEDEGIETPVLSDRTHEVLSGLGLWLPREQHPLPAIVLFDRCGAEAARWVGRQPGDRPESDVIRVLRKLSEQQRVCDRPSA